KATSPLAEDLRRGQLASGDFFQDCKHPLRHTWYEAGCLVIVVGKKPLPAATTGRDEARHVVRDTRLRSFQGYGFKRHRRSCLTGDMLRHAHTCLRDMSVDDGWPLHAARAQGKPGRRSYSQTCLQRPLFRHVIPAETLSDTVRRLEPSPP